MGPGLLRLHRIPHHIGLWHLRNSRSSDLAMTIAEEITTSGIGVGEVGIYWDAEGPLDEEEDDDDDGTSSIKQTSIRSSSNPSATNGGAATL
jgi:hypothetical protein